MCFSFYLLKHSSVEGTITHYNLNPALTLPPGAGKSTFAFLVKRCWKLRPCLRKSWEDKANTYRKKVVRRKGPSKCPSQRILIVLQELDPCPGSSQFFELVDLSSMSFLLGKLQIDFCPWSSRVPINTSNVSKIVCGKKTNSYYFLNILIV